MMPTANIDSLRKEPQIHRLLIEELNPKDGDVVIIASSEKDRRIAELSAKSAALFTVMNHKNHN
jgi:F420-0:gamma-glutamyl ligase